MTASSGAVRGYGSIVEIIQGVNEPVKLVGVEEFDFPDQTPDDIPTTHLESPGDTEEAIPGMNKLAPWQISLPYVPGGAIDTLLATLAGSHEDVILRLTPVGATASNYAAYVKSWRPTGIKANDKMMGQLSMTVKAKVVA